MIWVAAPENRSWFFLIVGGMVLIAATLVGAGYRDRSSRLIWRLVLWTFLIVVVAFLRLRVWPPSTEVPPLGETISEFVLPLLVIVGAAFGVGIGLGRMVRLHKGQEETELNG